MMRRIGVENDDDNTLGRIGGGVVAGHGPRWASGQSNERKALKGLVARLDVSVPNRVKHLMPFVGAKDDDFVALGDIGKKTVGSGDGAESSVAARDRLELRDSIVERSEARIVLAERVRGKSEVDAIEAELCDGSFGQMHMRDCGRIKGAGINGASWR